MVVIVPARAPVRVVGLLLNRVEGVQLPTYLQPLHKLVDHH